MKPNVECVDLLGALVLVADCREDLYFNLLLSGYPRQFAELQLQDRNGRRPLRELEQYQRLRSFLFNVLRESSSYWTTRRGGARHEPDQ